MSLAVAEEPRIVHTLPGRVRVHLPGWEGRGQRGLETSLRRIGGVREVRSSPLTRNVLVRFDPEVTDDETILTAVQTLEPQTDEREEEPEAPPVQREKRGPAGRVRIAVRGMDRDPDLAHRVVERLERWPSVRASASQLTGRVLVEFDEHQVQLEDLLSEITDLELTQLPGEDRPTHPLDREPLIESAVRTTGAALGLGLLGARRLFGLTVPPVPPTSFATAAGVITLLEGFPATRNAMYRLFGKRASDLVFSTSTIALFTLSGNVLGLVGAGVGALQLFTEVRARREAWRNYEGRVENAAPARPDARVRLEPGERTPLAAKVLEGAGTAVGRDGLPAPVFPEGTVEAGARLAGGPFTLRLRGEEPFVPEPRPEPVAEGTLRERYTRGSGLVSLAYTAATALFTRSLSRAFTALLLVNPRTAVIGTQFTDLGASARVLRSGVTVVGTRPDRSVRLPDVLLLDGPRVLTQGFEVNGVLPQVEGYDAAEMLALASGVAAAAGSPWGKIFPATERVPATDGAFDGETATALVKGKWYSLGPIEHWESFPAADRLRSHGNYPLMLYSGREQRPLGILALRPKLAAGIAKLIEACERHEVEVALLGGGDPAAAQSVAQRAGVPLLSVEDAVAAVRERQRDGKVVALMSDNARAAAGFAACDLAIGLTSGRSSNFPARADLLAPDLEAVAATVESGSRREAAVRDSVLFSMLADVLGLAWGLRGAPGVVRAGLVGNAASIGAMVAGWMRLRGGKRPGSVLSLVPDPRPERWGRESVASVLRTLETTESGLTSEAAAQRRRTARMSPNRNRILGAMLEQLRSPMTAILAAGAGLSLVLGSIADVLMIAAVIAANAVVSAWQERQAGQAAEALQSLATVNARVLRDGLPTTIPADQVVPGDVLLLASGDRVAADARLIEAQGLEVDEAALTGESLPVLKTPDAHTDAGRVVLEGSDVTVGTGQAAVVAVGRHTRMGATAAALALQEEQQGALGARLSRLLRQMLPLIVAGGAIVTGSGLLWRRPLLQQFAIGASAAIAVVPEGLPLLVGTGEAAVANRLAERNALVRRLSAIETLGRVDVACADKTGTLTEGRLVLSLVSGMDQESAPSNSLKPDLRRVLLVAALASPRPDAPDAESHPTDVSIVRGAQEAGLEDELWMEREAESPFDPAQAFHASAVAGRLCVKGATEALIDRCDRIRGNGKVHSLDEATRKEFLARADDLAERGLRVLMVAEGPSEAPVNDPGRLVALGFLGISDPLKPGVPEAVRRCHEAGVRVIMLTGDHPATARAIACEAGLPLGNDRELLTGEELTELDNGDLDELLEHATVISRITPLDKLRIVESLQRRSHTVAMTGDGVNDAPALRLADVGVAMGRGGTDVARQASDVVLADDDFSTLVETLVEGRSFWRNIRRALGLLLGGNLGELGLMVGASALSPITPLNSRQILAVNLVSDVLPALSVAFQQPKHRNLAGLDREGEATLERPLRNDVLRRGIATAAPALAAYLIALAWLGMPAAGSVAFASVVVTQLAQTLALGRNVEGFSRPVLGAVAGSTGLLVAALVVGPFRTFLSLSPPALSGWALIGAAALAAVPLNRLLASPRWLGSEPPHAARVEGFLGSPRGGAALSPA
ncbi:MAG: HAD-IC family P-type ATPase [Rubrobacter sp.]|nr:HAD-IC family P-type ATPase [Rubrobacter sp.]